jgi:probable HAF family extracellular repeat protein
MKASSIAMTLLFNLGVLSVTLVAQEKPTRHHLRYKVIDLGTLGGTFAEPGGINNFSEIAGFSTLPGDSELNAFFWSRGHTTVIPGLGGPNSSAGWAISDWGQVGVSGDTGVPDPLGEDFCGFGNFAICLPFVWERGRTSVLPLPAGNNGAATGFNNRNEVTGKVEQATFDSSCQGVSHQTQGVVWKNGKIERLLPNYPGDLQGAGHSINDLGQAVGWSGNCFGPPANHALLWDHGKRVDLGSLGGISGQAYNINNRSEIVGFSRVAAGPRHGFLWRRGMMVDLGLLPGDLSSEAAAINDQGEIVGFSTDASGNERAFLWRHDRIEDLNTLVAGDSPLDLLEGDYINEKGEIVGIGMDQTSGEIHGYLATLIAVDDDEDPAATHLFPNTPPPFLAESIRDQLKRHLRHRHMAAEDEIR